jgi:threonine dehydratase
LFERRYMTHATLERRQAQQPRQETQETHTFLDIYHEPNVAELIRRVDIVREMGVPPLVIESRPADLPTRANIKHYNLRTDQGPDGTAPCGTFKVRGASYAVYHAMQRGETFIAAASAGNHGQGVAYAVGQFAEADPDVRAKIWMSGDTPPGKVAGVLSHERNYNPFLELDLTSGTFAQADAAAQADPRSHYISPYNNYEVIAGQSTVAIEALAEHPETDKLFVAVGGGGLLAGMLEAAATMKAAGLVNPDLKVVAVVFEGNDSLVQTRDNEWVPSPATSVDTLTEGAAVPVIGAIPAELVALYSEHLLIEVVTKNDLAETLHTIEQSGSDFPLDETTSLLPRAGALKMAKARNHYDNREVWLTMTTGINSTEEKLQTLRDLHAQTHYQESVTIDGRDILEEYRIARLSRAIGSSTFNDCTITNWDYLSAPRTNTTPSHGGSSVASGPRLPGRR